MKLLIHDFAGHPFQLQLSRTLARRGHEVLHVYCGSVRGVKGATSVRTDDPPTLRIESVEAGEPFERYALTRRVLSEYAYGRALSRRILTFRPDLVLSANTPLIAQTFALRATRRSRGRFAFWQQDVLSVAISAALSDRIGRVGAWVGRLFLGLERHLLRSADVVVVISADYLPLLRNWGLDVSGFHIIENWAPLDEIPALAKRKGRLVAADLDDRVVFLYAGTLGLKHDPSLLIDLADAVPTAAVVVVSDGVGADWLRERQREAPRNNLHVQSGVPYGQLPEVLAAADVLVALLEPDAAVFSVPSKVLTYLCAGRAILAAVPVENLAYRVVVESGAGVAVAPADRNGFLNVARSLAADSEARERHATAALVYARTEFDVEMIADRFERAFAQAPNRAERPRAVNPTSAASLSRAGSTQSYELHGKGDRFDAQG